MGALLGSPREAGGTLRRGAIVNSALAIGMRTRERTEGNHKGCPYGSVGVANPVGAGLVPALNVFGYRALTSSIAPSRQRKALNRSGCVAASPNSPRAEMAMTAHWCWATSGRRRSIKSMLRSHACCAE